MEYIVSNIIYLCVFFLSLFIFRRAENKLYAYEQFYSEKQKETKKYRMSKDKFKYIVFSVLGLFIISFFAGIRANEVGADTSGYPIRFMKIATQSTSFTEFVENCSELKNEPLGALLVYFCSCFTADSGLLLFFYQLLTVVPIFLAAKKFRKYISITDAMAVYLFMFFNNSLNMMRQSVACAFILLGFSDWLIKNKISKKSILLFISAILFHRASIYGIALILAFYYIYKIKAIDLKKIIYIVIILLPLFLEILANILVKFIRDPQILYYIDIFIYKNISQDWFINPFSIYSMVYLIAFLRNAFDTLYN